MKIAIKEISASQLPRLAEIFNMLGYKWDIDKKFTVDNSEYDTYKENTVYFLYPEENKITFQDKKYLERRMASSDAKELCIYTAEKFINKHSKNIAVKCANTKYLIKLGKILNDLGYVWAGGDYGFLACAHYSEYKENTVYFLDTTNKTITYQDQMYLKNHLDRFNVYEVEEFILKYSKDMKKNIFTIQDLHSNMVIECENGYRYLILETNDECKLWGVRTGGKIKVGEDYSSTLECNILSEFNINKVYKIKEVLRWENLLKIDNLTLIWERPKEFVVTLDEIARKFNVDVSLLKIRK